MSLFQFAYSIADCKFIFSTLKVNSGFVEQQKLYVQFYLVLPTLVKGCISTYKVILKSAENTYAPSSDFTLFSVGIIVLGVASFVVQHRFDMPVSECQVELGPPEGNGHSIPLGKPNPGVPLHAFLARTTAPITPNETPSVPG